MASEQRIQMGGDLIRHHVTNAPISEDSMLYPIAEFLQLYSIPFNKHVLMLWIAAFVTILISLWATKSYNNSIRIPLLWRIPRIGKKFFIYEANFQKLEEELKAETDNTFKKDKTDANQAAKKKVPSIRSLDER